MHALPARHVHLDFHTSEHMTGVGKRFSKKQFQEALRVANVNFITLFAKCHHGWSYYPTKVGQKHPNLKINLLKQQIEACQELGVRTAIYYTVGWSVQDADAHPDWRMKRRDGQYHAYNVDANATPETARPGVSWQHLCPTGGYRELMLRQTEEICRMFPVEGMFYDICLSHGDGCWCEHCLRGMRAEGIDLDNVEQTRRYDAKKWTSFMTDCKAVIGSKHPEATAFFNGTVYTHTPEWCALGNTHFELEDLPTTWGGYDKFPLRAKLFGRYGRPMMAMSGKFHTIWGEFGGFKHPDAIRFEAASMIAYGSACSFGDQLHPSGEMELETYRRIGEAYRYVKKIEEYGLGGKTCANLAVVLSGDAKPGDPGGHDQGTVNMLLETHRDFDVLRASDLHKMHADVTRYQTIVLTGDRILDDISSASLRVFVALGGSLLVLGDSALAKESDDVLLDIGARYVGAAREDCDYTVVDADAAPWLARDVVTAPFLNYIPASRYVATDGEVLATVREPMFSRTYGKYCSHLNTPYQLEDAGEERSGGRGSRRPERAVARDVRLGGSLALPSRSRAPSPYVGAVQKGNVILIPHAIGKMYYLHGARLHRQLFDNALARLHATPTVEVELPSAGRVNVIHQREKRRYVVHLLYGPPLQRGRCLVIEDLVAIGKVGIKLRVPEKIKTVRLPLSRTRLKMGRLRGGVSVVVPELRGHEVVVFEY